MNDKIILTIGESKPKKWKPISFLIMLIEGTDHSHSFVSWKDENLKVRKVAEAKGSGGRIVSNHEFKRCNHVVRGHHYYVDKDKIKTIEKFIWENLRGYGYKQIAGIFLMRLGKVFGVKLSNPFKDGLESMICVELSANVMAIAKELNLNIEDIGMIEAHELNLKHRDSYITEENIARINGKK